MEAEFERYFGDDAVYTVNGFKIGLVQRGKERLVKKIAALHGIGDGTPSEYICCGREYELEIVRIPSDDLLDFTMLENFYITVEGHSEKLVYGPCKVRECEITRDVGKPAEEKIVLCAKERRYADV